MEFKEINYSELQAFAGYLNEVIDTDIKRNNKKDEIIEEINYINNVEELYNDFQNTESEENNEEQDQAIENEEENSSESNGEMNNLEFKKQTRVRAEKRP